MNQPLCIVCTSNQPVWFLKLYPTLDNRNLPPLSIHPICLLFYSGSDWIYQNEYFVSNHQLYNCEHNKPYRCQLCNGVFQNQQLLKCHDISCLNYVHIGCVINLKTVIFYNKQHDHYQARFLYFCQNHSAFAAEKELRGHIFRIDKRNLEQHIQQALQEHIQQKERYSNILKKQQEEKSEKKPQTENRHRHDKEDGELRFRHKHKKSHRHRSSRHYRDRERDRSNSYKKSHRRKERSKHKHSISKRKKPRKSSRSLSSKEVSIEGQFSVSESPAPKKEEEQIVQEILKDNNDDEILKSLFEKQQFKTTDEQQFNGTTSVLKIRKRGQPLQPEKQEIEKKEEQIEEKKDIYQEYINKQKQIELDEVEKKKQKFDQLIASQELLKNNREGIETNTNIIPNRKKKNSSYFSQRDVFDMIKVYDGMYPVFPSNENDSKRDQYVAAWWECVNYLYFPEQCELKEEEMEVIKIQEYQKTTNLKWYQQQINQDLLNYSWENDQFDPLVCLRFQLSSAINVLYKHRDHFELFRYVLEHNLRHLDLSQSKVPQNWAYKIQPFGQSELKLEQTNDLVQSQNQRELLFLESTKLTREEFEECLTIDKRINEIREKLENDESFDGGDQYQIGELDIAYHYLEQDLEKCSQFNNNMKRNITNSLINESKDINKMIEEQYFQMDLLKWTKLIQSIQRGYQDKTDQILNTYYRVQIAPDSSKTSLKGLTKMQKILSKQNEKPLDTDCKICFDGDMTDGNPIVYCDNCQTSFHKICYGISGLLLDQQEILCDGCKLSNKKTSRMIDTVPKNQEIFFLQVKAVCNICKKMGWPQKQIKNNFYHVACLILTNSVCFDKGSLVLRNDVTTKMIKSSRKESEKFLNQCAICGFYKGYKFQCCGQNIGIKCQHTFHPICAYLNGMFIEIETDNLVECAQQKTFSQVRVRIKCAKHMGVDLERHLEQVYYRRFGLNFEQTAKIGGYEKFKEEYCKTMGYNYLLSQTPNKRRRDQKQGQKNEEEEIDLEDSSFKQNDIQDNSENKSGKNSNCNINQ